MGLNDDAMGSVYLGYLFNGHDVCEVIRTGAAIALGKGHAHQSQLPQLGYRLVWILCFFVNFC